MRPDAVARAGMYPVPNFQPEELQDLRGSDRDLEALMQAVYHQLLSGLSSFPFCLAGFCSVH